jgi:hypothetical protein
MPVKVAKRIKESEITHKCLLLEIKLMSKDTSKLLELAGIDLALKQPRSIGSRF